MTLAIKPVKRETLSSVRTPGRRYKWAPLVIEIHATFVRIRPKGKRLAYTVTMDQIYTMGARNAAEATRRERAEARKNRKAGK